MKSFVSRARAALAPAFLAILLAGAPDAPACSICRCGDATFNALGTNVFADGAFRLAVDWDRFEKTQAFEPSTGHGREASVHDTITASEDMLENRVTTTLSYGFGERVNVVARVPFSHRRIMARVVHHHGAVRAGAAAPTHTTVSDDSASGVSDPEIYGLVRIWASDFSPGLGRRSWVSGVAGVKTPWGRNEVEEDGSRLDEHLQPGTGSTDVFGGLAAAYLLDERSSLFGSVQARRTGTNAYDYRYGSSLLANAGYEREIAPWLDAVLELNYRAAARDRVDADGGRDANTGGAILYVTPRAAFGVGAGLVVRAAVQIPMVRNLNGEQRERAVATAALTYVFR